MMRAPVAALRGFVTPRALRYGALAMHVEIAKGKQQDRITMRLDDGRLFETTFPHKGPIPHDAVHYFVERGLGLKNGFWGMIASGIHPEDVQRIAAEGGHASASRAQPPSDNIVELLQAERLVECFEADLWTPSPDDASFIEVAATACEYSFVPLPANAETALAVIRNEIAEFAIAWVDRPIGEVFAFDWQ